MNTQCFQNYKNKHIGKRVFLIGNGPSLNKTNLDLLANEYTIAMNRIPLLYKNTIWRPTYYIFCSSNCVHSIWGKEWTHSVQQALQEPKTTGFIWNKYQAVIDPNRQYNNVQWMNHLSGSTLNKEYIKYINAPKDF